MPISSGPFMQSEINAATVNVSSSASDVNTFGTTTITITSASIIGQTGTLTVTSTFANPVAVTGTVEIAGGVQFTGSITAINNSVQAVGAVSPGTATLIAGIDDSGNVAAAHIDANGFLGVYVSGGIVVNPGTGSQVVTASFANPVAITGTVTVANDTWVPVTGCSTTTPLLANQTFSGTMVDTQGFAGVAYSIATDVTSALGGIQIQFSPDTVNWDVRFSRSLGLDRVGDVTDLAFRTHDRYFRIAYTNGGQNQTYFRLNTWLLEDLPSGDTVGADAKVAVGMDALLTKAILTAKITGTDTYTDVACDVSGAIAIRGIRTPTDNYGNPDTAINSIGLNMVWDDDQAFWVRVGKGDIDADGDALNNVGLTKAESYVKVFNGSTFDRLRGDTGGVYVKTNGTDSLAVSTGKLANTSVTLVAASTSSATLAPINTSRMQLSIYNGAATDLYLKLGTGAATSSFSLVMPAGAYYELPVNNGVYTGIITGIWSAASAGSASMTEVTL